MEIFLLHSRIHCSLVKAILASLFSVFVAFFLTRKGTKFLYLSPSLWVIVTSFQGDHFRFCVTNLFFPFLFPDDSIFDTSWITSDLVFHLRSQSHNHLHILTRLAGLTAVVLAIDCWYRKCFLVCFNFFPKFSQIMFKIDCEKRSTYSISRRWSYIWFEWFCVCSLNFDF